MNVTAHLTVKWSEYDAANKDATIADFYRHEVTL